MNAIDYDKIIDALEKRIEQRWGQLEFNSSIDINSLLDARTYYTGLYSFLGEKEAALRYEYQTAEKMRKRAFIEEKIKFLKEGNSATKAEALAENEINEFRDKEIEAESQYHLYRLRRESAKEVIAMLAQLISFVKQEREQTQFQKG